MEVKKEYDRLLGRLKLAIIRRRLQLEEEQGKPNQDLIRLYTSVII